MGLPWFDISARPLWAPETGDNLLFVSPSEQMVNYLSGHLGINVHCNHSLAQARAPAKLWKRLLCSLSVATQTQFEPLPPGRPRVAQWAGEPPPACLPGAGRRLPVALGVSPFGATTPSRFAVPEAKRVKRVHEGLVTVGQWSPHRPCLRTDTNPSVEGFDRGSRHVTLRWLECFGAIVSRGGRHWHGAHEQFLWRDGGIRRPPSGACCVVPREHASNGSLSVAGGLGRVLR